MGLLDEAIREHLELKRLHGADPSEVYREEQEAFGAGDAATPFAEDSPAVATARAVATAHPPKAAEETRGVPVFEWVESLRSDESPISARAVPPMGEETMELDMGAVLAASGPPEASAPVPSAGGAIPVRAGAQPPGALW